MSKLQEEQSHQHEGREVMKMTVNITCTGCDRKRKYVIGEGGVRIPPCPNCSAGDLKMIDKLIRETGKLTAEIKKHKKEKS